MRIFSTSKSVIRYRGFVLIEQLNKSWLIRPEKSPLVLLPFRTSICSLIEAKQILESKLSEQERSLEVA
ncbi:hypothetical protein [Prochlorococcus sp. MIT 0602]|nr:hypothetical protein [Prochlorococcus sp. MIT 0602]